MAAAAYAANRAHKKDIHSQKNKKFKALQESLNGLHHFHPHHHDEDEVDGESVKKSLKKGKKPGLFTDDDLKDLPIKLNRSKEKVAAEDLYLEDCVFLMSESLDANSFKSRDLGPWMPTKAILGRERIFFTAPCWNKEGKNTEVIIEDLPLLLIDWTGLGVVTDPNRSGHCVINVEEENSISSLDGRGQEGYKKYWSIMRKQASTKIVSVFRYLGLVSDEEIEFSQTIRVQQPPALNPLESNTEAEAYLQIFVSCSGK
jgi:hypothetical protein